jgi:hypothetical protein
MRMQLLAWQAICSGEDRAGAEERCLDLSGGHDGMSNKTILRVHI